MTEPRYVKMYCETARREELERAPTWKRWQASRSLSLGKTLAEKVEGQWRCRCCGVPVRVVW